MTRKKFPRVSGRYQPTVKGERAARLVSAFLRGFVRHPDRTFAGELFRLEPWQIDGIIRPIFGCLNRAGDRKYREAIIGLPRNSGKSTLAAGLLLAIAFAEPIIEAEYVIVARNRNQAKIVFGKIRRMVLSDPMLRAACEVRTSEVFIRETGQRIYTVAYDAGSAQGIHAQVCIIDEYHVHKDDSMRYAMLSGMIGQPGALLITISTAGPMRSGPLWELLESARTDPSAYVYWVGAREKADGNDPATWREANPQSWVSDDDLSRAFYSMPFIQFERYHLNRWPKTGTYEAAIPPEVWLSEKNCRPPVLADARTTVMAVDAADKRDRTAVAVVQVDDDGDYHAWVDIRDVERTRGYHDYLALEDHIRSMAETTSAERILFDRRQMARTMELLEDEGLPVEEFPQTNDRMCAASQHVYDLAVAGRLRHGGDPELARHAASAAPYQRPPLGWRFAKSNRSDPDCKIDGVIALAMAAWGAQAEESAPPSFAETGGVYTFSF